MIHRTLSEHYERERLLRLEAVRELKENDKRSIQLQLADDEAKRNERTRPDPTEGPRQEVRLAQYEAAKASQPPPTTCANGKEK